MNVVIVFAIVAILLFFAAFMTRRRFGLLGLALAAGSILSTIWNVDAGLLVGSIGIFPKGELTTAITLSVIVLLPAIVLLFHGRRYKNMFGRIVGSLFFAALALAFLVEPLGYALPVGGVGADIYKYLVEYKEVIISIGIVVAIMDLYSTKPPAPVVEKKSKR